MHILEKKVNLSDNIYTSFEVTFTKVLIVLTKMQKTQPDFILTVIKSDISFCIH